MPHIEVTMHHNVLSTVSQQDISFGQFKQQLETFLWKELTAVHPGAW